MNSWFAHHKTTADARMRLFCFPYAGGGATIYRDWSGLLPRGIQVYPVQLPGRGGRIAEPPFTRITDLVEAISDAILPLLDKPFAFFGHSLGAKISFELARYLQRTYGLTASHLFVSACSAPHLPTTEKGLHELPEPKLMEKLHSLNGTSSKVLNSPRLMRMALPAVRADFEIYDTYRYMPGPLFNCPITVLGGTRDPVVAPEHLVAWRNHAMADFNLRFYPGDHFFIHSAQSVVVQTVAQALEPILESLAESSSDYFPHNHFDNEFVMEGEPS